MKFMWLIMSLILFVFAIFHPVKGPQDFWSPAALCGIMYYIVNINEKVDKLK